ncbi:non-ribosomal peptide synthetase [Xanthomonas sp. D-109]|uniref:non-ribosomal peptide synthetase n=1 Tax=Xanthomonas sp. D-109 TaxID=2821274 RepID=UPI001ADBDCDA|nr:non-ribosomal peptide synthetase [Xanthomonas sp. D-109]MBO9883275.1 amino acid adenylation domain-containing protein [Xanthomonas sp. D-109]
MLLFELVQFIEENNIGISVADGRLRISGNEALLTEPVVAALKAHKSSLIARYAGALPALPASLPSGEPAPLSFAQRRLYFLYQLDQQATHFNLPIELELRGHMKEPEFVKALESTVARHRIYRTTYEIEAGLPVQRFRDDLVFKMELVEADGPDGHDVPLVLAARERIACRPFDLASELPVRGCLLRHAPDNHTLLFCFHHIATDEWSIRNFVSEFAKTYRDLLAKHPLPEPQDAMSYLDYAAWQTKRFEAGIYDVSRSYWRHALEGAKSVLELPLDAARPPVQGFAGGLRSRTLPASAPDRIARFAREHRISDYAFLLGAYCLLLHRLSGDRDLVVGTDVYGRDQPGLQDMAGFFVNQLAQRCRIQDAIDVGSFLHDMHASVLAAFNHQDMPFDQIVDDLGVERDAAFPPIFQVKFLYEREAPTLPALDGLEVHQRTQNEVRSQYDLTLKISGDKIEAFYNRDLFHAETIDSWLDLYLELIEACLEDASAPIHGLLDAPLARRLAPLVHGDVVPVDGSHVFTRFDTHLERAPDAIAVSSPDSRLSYRQFASLADRIAARLARMGVRPGDKVGVFLERSPELAVAVFAVMRMGGVFVPLDPSYPSEHTDHTLQDSGVGVVVTSEAMQELLPEHYGFVLHVDALSEDDPPPYRWPRIDDHAPAYLLYTSGSTGQPKGALIDHRAFANLCDWYIRFAELDANCRVLLMIPIGFDASIKNVFVPLMTGGTLVLARPDRFDPADQLLQIASEGVTLINCAPSAAYALLREDQARGFASLRSLRMLAMGGEALDRGQLLPWLASTACTANVANIYGPTECTDISVAYRGDRFAWLQRDSVVIGRPIQNVRAWIVDAELRPVPQGVAGELVIAGFGVGIGYHERAALTESSFVALPGLERRVYRTGDYCRLDRDGNIVYLGRRDGQIKIRGKRVEVGEIMHQLGALLPSRAVSIQRLASDGSELLLAFIDGGPAPISSDQIKTALLRQLPRHMVPAQFVFVDTLPLTTNGKVCSRSLIALFEAQRHRCEGTPIELDPVERTIASVWERLLHIDVRQRDDDFFSLGGDSILSIQAVAELREQGINLTVADLFRYPTLRDLAAFASESSSLPPDAEVARHTLAFSLLSGQDRERLPPGLEDAYPATPLQLGMLFHSLLDERGAAYHDVFSFRLQFDYDEAALRRAIEKVVSEQPVLRTGFDLATFSIPLQLVHRDVVAHIQSEDISTLDDAAQNAFVHDRVAALKRQKLPLEGPSLIRFTLLRLGEDRLQCIIDAHHAILDGWSMATLERQILEYYRHDLQGTALADVFDTGGLRYADYVATVAADASIDESIKFWDAFCQALPPLRRTAPVARIAGPFAQRQRSIDGALALRVQILSERTGVPIRILMLMAHGQVLRSLVGQPDILTGNTDNGRLEARGSQNMIGLFLNVLPTHLPGGLSWHGQAAHLRQIESHVKPHRRYALASILQRNPGLTVDANFTYTNFHVVSKFVKSDWLQVELGEQFEEVNFEFATHVGGDVSDGFQVVFSSRLGLSDAYAERLFAVFTGALDAMTVDFDAAIPMPLQVSLPVLPFGGTSAVHLLRRKASIDPSLLHDSAERTVAAAVTESSALQALNGRGALDLISLETGSGANGADMIRSVSMLAEERRAVFAAGVGVQDGWHMLCVATCAFPADSAQTAISDFIANCVVFDDAAAQWEVAAGEGLRWVPFDDANAAFGFWATQLRDVSPRLALPLDRPGSAAVPTVRQTLHSIDVEAVEAFARCRAVDPDVVWISAFSALLARLSGDSAFAIGWTASNSDGQPTAGALPILLEPATTTEALLGSVARGRGLAATHALPSLEDFGAWLQRHGTQAAFDAIVVRDANLPLPQCTIALCLHNATPNVVQMAFNPALIAPDTIARWSEQMGMLLRGMLADPAAELDALPVLPPAQREQVLESFNATRVDYPQGDRLVHELFEMQVSRNASAVALECDGNTLDYAQLNRLANRVAHALIAQGVGPDVRVAICAERGFDLVVGLLGILKAGGAYVPLDPGYPVGRLDYMLEDSAPRLLLSVRMFASTLPKTAVPILWLDDASAFESMPEHDPEPRTLGLTASHLAYVIYTSGSTGRPKGAMNQHDAVVNRLLWAQSQFALCADDRILQKTPAGFDVSVWEFFLPLLAGARLVLARPEGHKDPAYLADLIESSGITMAHFVPSMLRAFTAAVGAGRCRGLRQVLCSGEVLPAALQNHMLARWPDTTLYNLYGPTEAAVDVTCWRCEPSDDVPIGRPIANTRIYVVDRHYAPVPVGVVGELLIGGVQVGRGYLGRPDLTSERFFEDPFLRGGRVYRTGDLARWRHDGVLEYLGRNDFQVKVRGFRIELGEIEAQLSACDGVREAIVIARDDAAGAPRLVAYVVADPHREDTLSASALREWLSSRLADHMLPSAFVLLPALPVTPNGKLDRAALPVPDHAALASRAYASPEGHMERALAGIWSELLGIERVGREDHFFELGGHSLIAVQVVARVRATLAVEVPLRVVFLRPVLRELASALEEIGSTKQRLEIERADREASLPLSWAQQRLWFLDRLDPAASLAYHIPAAFRLTGYLHRQALGRALDRIVARHEVLRTRFELTGRLPTQQINAETTGFRLIDEDLSGLPAEARASALQRFGVQEAEQRFDLSCGPLIRGRLLKISAEEHVLLVTQHHIVSDGWSIGILSRELMTLYNAFAAGKDDPLPPLPIQYVDYAVWQRHHLADQLTVDAAYWREQLADAPTLLELPTDRPRPAVQTYAGSSVAIRIPPSVTSGLREIAQRNGATLFMTLLAAWSVLLTRLSGQDEVVIGSPVANREREEIEPLVGFFVNTLALRVRMDDATDINSLLTHVRSVALDAYAHQALPLDQVVEAVQPVRNLSHNAIFQSLISLDTTHRTSLQLDGLTLEELTPAQTSADFDLSLSLIEEEGGLSGRIEYATDLFDRSTIQRWTGYFSRILDAFVSDASASVASIPLLPQDERNLLLRTFNATARNWDTATLVHAEFEMHALRTPARTAILFEDRVVDYAHLNAMANRIAHSLLSAGVVPDTRVALCFERSPEMIAAMLGVLKAGGAYVPLDPAYPQERLATVLSDCSPKVVLTTSTVLQDQPWLAASAAQVILADAAQMSTWPDTNPVVPSLLPSHLAYLIYTSGSTGRPKGVMVEHRQVSNLIRAQCEICSLQQEDRILQFATYAFDSSVEEIFPALSIGATLVLRPASLVAPDQAFVALLDRHAPDLLNLPTAFWQQWCQEVVEGRLVPQRWPRMANVGGEKMERRHLAAWLSSAAGSHCDILNTYGPTETTVNATSMHFLAGSLPPDCDVPIGRPIPNASAYVLDSHGQPVPIGVAGELHIGGEGVTRGYFGAEPLTSEKFVPDPFSPEGGRMYRTGDLCRWRLDGTLEYIGRNDFQVKIRGFRIELGEIESKLQACEGVRDAIVVARDTPAGKRLIAYVVAREGAELTAQGLRDQLSRQLADVMLPSAFVALAALPMTPNGKLDRKALPLPDDAALVAHAYEAPDGEAEQALAQIWSELLGVKRVGRRDQFFELGGHSLTVVQLTLRIQEIFGVHVSAMDIFQNPMFADLSELILTAQLGDCSLEELQALEEALNAGEKDMAHG